MERLRQPIGVFDSGLGGISVLAEAVRALPFEDFLYFGDSLHVPYGDKSPEEVLLLTRGAVSRMLGMGCKAIVLACNTATSAAAAALRQELPQPIVGIEPALKPASLLPGDGNVLVLATLVTLSQPKFQQLMQQYGKGAIPVPCSGLVEYVEAGQLSGPEVEECLLGLLSPYLAENIKAVVLGCTHYTFLRRTISALLGPNIPIVDGGHGTAMQLRRVLDQKDLLQPEAEGAGEVSFLTTAVPKEAMLAKMTAMLALAMEQIPQK